jgi:hypothetical protein
MSGGIEPTGDRPGFPMDRYIGNRSGSQTRSVRPHNGRERILDSPHTRPRFIPTQTKKAMDYRTLRIRKKKNYRREGDWEKNVPTGSVRFDRKRI